MKAPIFIAFEGIDGSGKSTQIKLLEQNLLHQKINTYVTCEPTKSKIGLLIRDIFQGKENASHETVAALFAADRLEHILHKQNGMLAYLNKGYVVLTDRYYFSSYAYHSVHVPMPWVVQCNAVAANLLKPTCTFFIDVAPEVCMERILKNRTHTELYENVENLKKVRDNYFTSFELLKQNERVEIINGNQPPEWIANEIAQKMRTILEG